MPSNMTSEFTFLHRFESPLEGISEPERFNFPFSYSPHPLSQAAVEQTQAYLMRQSDFIHPFGLNDDEERAIGKMFGVLVVKDQQGDLGFLAAVSGKLAGANHHRYFVPPVFDMLKPGDFFLQEEAKINSINNRLEQLSESEELQRQKAQLSEIKNQAIKQLEEMRVRHKANKKQRKITRAEQQALLNPVEYQALLDDLIKQSYHDQHQYDVLKAKCSAAISAVEEPLQRLLDEISALRDERRARSARLQNLLFEQYKFLNASGEECSLLELFNAVGKELPPAGAGECAAPKLLQYAYQNGWKPICMAEFWWGRPPGSEVRKHGYFYPACKGKCEPILAHMLKGLSVDPNPMLVNPAADKELPVVYQDEAIIVVNKPAEFLTVPGIHIQDSVQHRIMQLFPELDSPWIVHRLDMSTSGLLVLAKTKEAHEHLQRQFASQRVYKRYTALLQGIVEVSEGEINLPLRVDLDDRPRQIVCAEFGRPARTRFQVLDRSNGRTRVHFYPITGRTHQLRVHAAHALGLNTPMVGDDLYGQPADRLHLHAGKLGFLHPLTQKKMEFEISDPF